MIVLNILLRACDCRRRCPKKRGRKKRSNFLIAVHGERERESRPPRFFARSSVYLRKGLGEAPRRSCRPRAGAFAWLKLLLTTYRSSSSGGSSSGSGSGSSSSNNNICDEYTSWVRFSFLSLSPGNLMF